MVAVWLEHWTLSQEDGSKSAVLKIGFYSSGRESRSWLERLFCVIPDLRFVVPDLRQCGGGVETVCSEHWTLSQEDGSKS